MLSVVSPLGLWVRERIAWGGRDPSVHGEGPQHLGGLEKGAGVGLAAQEVQQSRMVQPSKRMCMYAAFVPVLCHCGCCGLCWRAHRTVTLNRHA